MTDEVPLKSPSQALLDAAAEVGIETMRQRRWIFLAVGALVSLALIGFGIAVSLFQKGVEPLVFGLGFIGAGILALFASVNSYQKAGRFKDAYDEQRERSD